MTSPGIPLTEFLDQLRIQKKIGPDDFTGDDLEDLSKEFAKALSVQNRNKLGIDKVTGRIGLTLVEEEDKRAEYATNCEILMSDKTKTTVLVNCPPDSDLYFRLPEKGPDPVPQSKLPVVDKPHGFRAMTENALIVPVWTDMSKEFGMAYRYDRGVPLVDHRPSGVMKDLPVVPVAWQLTQYCVHNPDKPDEIGEERFIFTGHSSGPKKNNSLQGFYMRLEDLKRRVETNNEFVAWSDVDELKKNRPLYPLWDPKGKLVHPDVFKQAFKTLEPKGSKSDDKVFQAKSLFLSHCQIARQARINAGLYDVLARFWDRLWEPNFYLYIDPKYQKDIREYAAKSATVAEHNAFPNSPNIDKEDIPVYILLNRIKEERQLKPKFTIVWRKDPLVDYLDKWGTHPNQLYTVYLDNEEMEKVEKNTTIGVWLPERSWPGKDNLLAADGVMKPNIPVYKSVKDAASTLTEVTKRSINIVKAFRRKPDQSTAMGRTSPNDLVRKWWGLAKDEKAAEWLHRSAWSYGGLYDKGKVDPYSSQTMGNLIIGTHETNTMMLRHEIFVKRYARYAKTKNGDDDERVPVHVTTTLSKRQGEKPEDESTLQVGWACARLHYEIKSAVDSVTPLDISVDFYPLERRLPTRLELDLDELFETMCYGWGDSNFMA